MTHLRVGDIFTHRLYSYTDQREVVQIVHIREDWITFQRVYSDEPPLMVLQSDGTYVDMTPYRGCVHVSTFAQPGWYVGDVQINSANTVFKSWG